MLRLQQLNAGLLAAVCC